MPSIKVGPTGRLITGNVLDVNVKKFTEALQAHDRDLYVKWNPKKLRGWGCWEIRRKSSVLTVTSKAKFEGSTIYVVENREIDFINHVLDCGYLNYDALRKIQEIDTWSNKKHWWHHQDSIRDAMDEKITHDAKQNMRYAIKQNKGAIKDFMELVRSGKNPAQVLSSIKWVYKDK